LADLHPELRERLIKMLVGCLVADVRERPAPTVKIAIAAAPTGSISRRRARRGRRLEAQRLMGGTGA
jgi:hypothetical protein